MGTEEKDRYFVAVKIFLRDGHKLLITHDVFGSWDLPGGRIKKEEFDTPLEEVVRRKMREELGDNIQYELDQPNNIFFRVERMEVGINQMVRIFAIGYDAKYLGGDIKIEEYHDRMEWVDVRTFKPEDYFTGGWLKGVKEYLEFQRRTNSK